MRILADEHIAGEIVAWLRSQDHDVVWAAETLRGRADEELLEISQREQRVILTRDLDFGELVFREGLSASPVILLRLHQVHPRRRLAILQEAWSGIENHIDGHFIVVTPHRLRLRRLERGL